MLPLTFADPADYDKIKSTDKISILGLCTFAPGKVKTLNVCISFSLLKKNDIEKSILCDKGKINVGSFLLKVIRKFKKK